MGDGLGTLMTSTRLHSYPVCIKPEGHDGTLVAKVNFDEKNELLFREICHLKWLGFEKCSNHISSRMPCISLSSKGVQSVYINLTPEATSDCHQSAR